jgi:hypothetical protein
MANKMTPRAPIKCETFEHGRPQCGIDRRIVNLKGKVTHGGFFTGHITRLFSLIV